MLITFPKDDRTRSWTRHIKNKMLFYNLSAQRIQRVMRSPSRVEEGIAPNTTAVMQRNDRGDKKEEIWVMYQQTPARANKTRIQAESRVSALHPRLSAPRRMISAWRYPGVSKPGKNIPIPENILQELGGLGGQ